MVEARGRPCLHCVFYDGRLYDARASVEPGEVLDVSRELLTVAFKIRMCKLVTLPTIFLEKKLVSL